MPGNQPQRGFFSPFGHVEVAPDGHHQGEQEQRETDTQHRQDAAAQIAKSVLANKTGQSHLSELRENHPNAANVRDSRHTA